MTSPLESEILLLREKSLTPKEIARKLSLKPFQVNAILKSSTTQTAIAKPESGELAPIAQCLVNSSCAERLLRGKTVEEHEIGGLGLVLVARNTGYKRFVACSYLVDYWCLGLKDTIGDKKLNDIKYQQFLKMVYDHFSDGYEEISFSRWTSFLKTYWN